MDEGSRQRVAGGLAKSKRSPNISFREPNHEDGNIRYCNRLGCSTRLNSMKNTAIINLEKPKYSRPSFRSSSSKAIVGSSSKPVVSGVNNLKKQQFQERTKRPDLPKETLVAESNKRQGEVEEQKDAETGVSNGLTMKSTDEVTNTKPQKQIRQSFSMNQNSSTGSSIQRPSSSKNANHAKAQGQNANAQTRYGLRSIHCASMNDILPSSSLSDSSRRGTKMVKRRHSPDGETSASRGKKTVGSSSGASSQKNTFPSSSLSSADCLASQAASRRTRNWSVGSSSIAPVRTQRTIGGKTSMRLPKSGSTDTLSLSVPEHVIIPEFSINEPGPSNQSQPFSTELPAVCQNSLRRPGSSNGTLLSRPISHTEDTTSRPFHSYTFDRDGVQRFNMEGIAEVLLALERIEQDEELTYEQLLVLESNLFLGGLSFHDQHRDMRLDIDNMSYEELLALEEKMGTVSTALSEEEMSKCLRRSFYEPAPPVPGSLGHEDDDIKCSICQDEYVLGDEVGKLHCEHRYHVACIKEWLQQKNWCPICKASAVVPSLSPSQAR